jgi:eukaryotic-like serine/threonine-protein kinase
MMTETLQTPSAEDYVLPGYRVVSLLRRGRRMDAFDVFSEERDCRCIVKRLRPDRADDTDARDAVLREGALLRDLTHPHLVRCYEVQSRPLPALVLETLPGATLAALVEQQRLTTPDLAMLGLQLTSVLGYLHRHGWLHLDVKPSNIVVESGRATLIDLSLVHRAGPGRPGAGTPGYMAPEQAHGARLSEAADVYGLAVTLTEAATGLLPYGDEATWDRAGRTLPRVPARRVRNLLRRRVPAEVAALLLGCLALNPAERPCLAEIRQTLHRHADRR